MPVKMDPYVGATMRAATIAKLIMQQPRTLKEVMVALGVTKNEYMRIQRYLVAYHDQGVIYVSGWYIGKFFRDYVPVYSWQPEPFKNADVPKPEYFTSVERNG